MVHTVCSGFQWSCIGIQPFGNILSSTARYGIYFWIAFCSRVKMLNNSTTHGQKRERKCERAFLSVKSKEMKETTDILTVPLACVLTHHI